MAEEAELLDLSNATSRAQHETLVARGDAVFLAVVVVGLAAHALIVYTTAKSARLRTRAHALVAHWIAFEMLGHNVLYPLLRYARLHAISYHLHMIGANVLFMTMLSALLCLNALIADAATTTRGAFLERFYAVQLTLYAIVLCWKMCAQHDVYMELALIAAYCVCWLALAARVLYRQCCRLVGRKATTHAGDELRLHLATFFLVGKVLVNSVGVAGVAYKSHAMMQLAHAWCLSGVYVIVVLLVKDVDFKISLFEVLGLNAKNPNDVHAMINEDKDGEENFAETCIEN